jgi:hypothetical protein
VCIYVCICMYVCYSTYTHSQKDRACVYICVCMYVCMYVCILYMCMYVCILYDTYTHTKALADRCVSGKTSKLQGDTHLYVYICVCMYIRMYVCIL